MTDTTISTIRSDWEKALERYTALRILFEADDQWGPLHSATAWMELYGGEIRAVQPGQVRQEAVDAYAGLQERHEAELSRHMATIYDPMMDAGLALIRTPAPDLAAVQFKHQMIADEASHIIDYEDEDGELFGIIKADVQRLTGLEA